MQLLRKKELRLTKAFKKCLMDDKSELSEDGKIIMAFLRDICGAKGELGKNGSPYFYDDTGRFDACVVAFHQGKRNVFDQINKYLALDENKILNLIATEQTEEGNFLENLNI